MELDSELFRCDCRSCVQGGYFLLHHGQDLSILTFLGFESVCEMQNMSFLGVR